MLGDTGCDGEVGCDGDVGWLGDGAGWEGLGTCVGSVGEAAWVGFDGWVG